MTSATLPGHSVWRTRLVHALRVVLVAAVIALLIALPLIGLRDIDRSHDDTSQLVDLWVEVEGAARLVVEADGLIRAAESPSATEEERSAFTAQITSARASLDALARSDDPESVGLGLETAAFVMAGREALEAAEARVAARDADRAVAAAAGRTYGDALARFFASIGFFAGGATGEISATDDDLTSRITSAELLAVAAALIGAAVFVAYATYEAHRASQREADSRARVAQAERQAAQREEMVNLASHELRNPLSVLTLSAEVMERTAMRRGDGEMAAVARQATGAARRAEALVAELLDLGRLDAGRLNLVLAPVALAPLIHDVARFTAGYRGERPTVIEAGPDARVIADGDRLGIILRNVLDNAYKYSPEDGAVTVQVVDDPRGVVIRVLDEGPGVDPEDRERVFRRFERLRPGEHVGGLGIGLHLSRELARRMGGELRVGDSAGGGCFELVLPAAPAPEQEELAVA